VPHPLEVVPGLCLIANGSGTPRLSQGNDELEYAGQNMKTKNMTVLQQPKGTESRLGAGEQP
jgi:hypothetical protein